MRNTDFLKLYADASGLRLVLLANRLHCEDEIERLLHDWVEQRLSRFIAFTREALAAERRFLANSDPAQDTNLAEDLYQYRLTYKADWCCETDCSIDDLASPEMVEFDGILRQIYRHLRISIPTYGLTLPVDNFPSRSGPAPSRPWSASKKREASG